MYRSGQSWLLNLLHDFPPTRGGRSIPNSGCRRQVHVNRPVEKTRRLLRRTARTAWFARRRFRSANSRSRKRQVVGCRLEVRRQVPSRDLPQVHTQESWGYGPESHRRLDWRDGKRAIVVTGDRDWLHRCFQCRRRQLVRSIRNDLVRIDAQPPYFVVRKEGSILGNRNDRRFHIDQRRLWLFLQGPLRFSTAFSFL